METQEWPADPADRVAVLIESFLDELDLDGEVEIEEDETSITATVVGEDEYGLLIGRRGQTIDALQSICFQAAFRGLDDRRRVTVDAAGYRARREEALIEKAEWAADLAVEEDREVRLEPMNARERRIVHEQLKDSPEVETWSTGEDPRRRVVVSPVDPE